MFYNMLNNDMQHKSATQGTLTSDLLPGTKKKHIYKRKGNLEKVSLAFISSIFETGETG